MIEIPVKTAEMSTSASGVVLKVDVPVGLRALTEDFLLAMKAEKEYILTLNERKKDRSLSQNAYFHVLANEIAAKTQQSNDDVKRELVFRYGTVDRDENGNVIGIMLKEGLSPKSISPYCQYMGSKEVDGKNFAKWLCYKHTSDMSKKEFSRLIDGAISEAQELGIQTMPPDEVKQLDLV